MEMNNLRVESHVAQKNRRHKLRFQQNSGDMNHQQPPQDHPQFEPKPFSYNPNIFPFEMLNSVARNPHLLLPPGHGFMSLDQDSFPGSDLVSGLGSSQPERVLSSSGGGGGGDFDCNNWKPVVGNDHCIVGYSNTGSTNLDNRSLSSGYYGYNQNVFSSPFYHEDQVTLAQPHQTKNDSGMNQLIPCWMNTYDHREGAGGATMAVTEGTCNTQGLSLSLSSVPQAKDDIPTLQPGEKHVKSDILPNSDPKSLMGVSSFGSGPLGPFTGYATILKNSKYLKPAQELLNENCDVGGQEFVQTCHDVFSQKILEEEMSRASGGSHRHIGGRISSGDDSLRPEFHQKKARLLYMQEEVCRRYKQYLQQMEMVISSFETVAGLSAATPYVCLALKAVSQHFHFVKNVISEQLLQIRKIMGVGLCSSTTTSSKAFDVNATSTSQLKSIDQRLGKSGSGAGGFFTSQQPVWRPQRGLPERAISVLKTWLFDHFLHPYPSDSDKHMLATQTGLTRNQVSNWFINARVRIWKPMVEEIHSLETKGMAEPSSTNTQLGGQDPRQMDHMHPPRTNNTDHEPLTAHEPSGNQKHGGRVEYQMPVGSMDQHQHQHQLMSIMPNYPRPTFDASGLGPVSLTLGLRQNVHGEQVQQLQQHFGGHLIHDFVG